MADKGSDPMCQGEHNDQGWLVVDDLVDTGATGRIVREMLPKAHFATIYAKPAGRPLVDTFVTEVSQDTWILFPWDTEPQYAQPIAGRAGIAGELFLPLEDLADQPITRPP